MKNYFEGCTTLDALKARYRIMAKALHPDLHPELGDEPMKALNAQFDELSAKLSRVSADGRTEATAEQARSAASMAAAYRDAVYPSGRHRGRALRRMALGQRRHLQAPRRAQSRRL